MARHRRQSGAPVKAAPQPPPKRHWVALVAVVLIAAGVLALWQWLRPAKGGAVILISIDTLRADHLPVYGYAKGRTPVIDAFAKDAIVFDRAYAHAPQTLPSHASILTGLLPFEHGVRDNLGFSLKSPTPTMASMFRAAHYRTGGFVSAYVLRAETGVNQGFDVYNAEFPAGSQERSVAQVQRPGLETLAATESWLGTLTDDKFFLFFHIYEPHKPYTPPARYAALDPYDGEIAFADEIVGRLLDDLKRRKWYDNATIVLLSDHGEGLGDHGEDEHGLFLYDSTIHVPLLIKLTANHDAGRRVADPVQHIDLLPTLASLSGLSPPAGLRGRNLVPLLLGRGPVAAQGVYAEALYARYHFGWSELLSLTDERYRFIKAPRQELYDLQRDPSEATNIVGDRGQVTQAMRSGLDALVAGRKIDAPSAVSAQDRERLAALGYVGTASPLPANQAGSTLPDPKDKAPVLQAYRAAVDAIGQGQLVQGAKGFRDILAKEPAMTDVWSQYGTVLLELGDAQGALMAFREVIRRQPNEPVALIDAATVLLKLGQLKEARAHAELAVKQMPAAAHELLAKVALARKDPEGALGEAALAERADPALPMPDYVHGLIEYGNAQALDATNPAGAKDHYTKALSYFMRAHARVAQRTMQIVDLRYYIADCLARLDRTEESEKFFREEIAIYPKNVRARIGLAMLDAASGKMADAETVITQMLTAIPAPETYQQVAKWWRYLGRADRADAVLAASRAKFGR
jgi:arylsulfatase A-like enzyme/tetratricopeptide (TPR) repeat protein